MIRDVLAALMVALLAIGGLWTAGIGRETIEAGVTFLLDLGGGREAREAAPDDAAAVAAMLDDGRVWCFWPDGAGRCAWALRADGPAAEAGFDVAIYAARSARETQSGEALEISVARSGVIFEGGRLCEDRDRPTTRDRLGYYEALYGVLTPDVRLRPATAADYDAFRATVPEAGGLVCFRFEGAPGDRWLMHVEADGAGEAPPEEFVIRERDAVTRLAPPVAGR